MVKRTEERKEVNEQKKDIFKTLEGSYTAISKIWGDSLTLYRPLLESTGELFGKSLNSQRMQRPKNIRNFMIYG